MEFVSQKTKVSAADDRELVLLARSGRQDAFVEIVARYQNLVAGVAFSILHDFAKSEDVAQDCFVKAWKRMHKLREPDKLRPWLAQIARNSALDHRRKNRSEKSPEVDFDLLEDPGSQPDESMVRAEERATVLKALASLPEKYRLPLILFYCDEKSIRAIAGALELSEGTVKKRLSRGRARLRERMNGLIDSVLGSARLSRSNTLFTASVATAIGALTKPSAMAAPAISSATISTNTTLSTSLAMASSKSTLSNVALLMAVSLPIGYSAHKMIEGDSILPAARHAEGVDSRTNLPLSSMPVQISLKESQLVEQWRKLRANYGDQHSDLRQLHAVVAEIPNRIHRRAFTAVLIAEWAERHGREGLQFFREDDRADWERDLFLHELFKRDASQAIDILMASGDGWKQFAPRFLNEIVRQSPHRLAEVVDLLPFSKSYYDLSVENAFDLCARNDLQSARQAAEDISGPNRAKALSGLARAWAAQDGQAALAWAESLKDSGIRESTMQAVLVGWARVDPHAALDQLSSVPSTTSPGPRNITPTSAAAVLGEAAKNDFDSTMAWIRENHGQLGEGDYQGLIPTFNERLLTDPTGFLANLDEIEVLGPVIDAVNRSLHNEALSSRTEIMEWLLSSGTSLAKAELTWFVLDSLATDQTASAMKIAEGFTDPEKREKAFKIVVSGMTHGNNDLHTANQVFDTASPIWKEAIVTQIFKWRIPENNQSFQNWANRMSLLPEANRQLAHNMMGLSWGKVEPLNALNWALARPDNEQREAAIKGVSYGWAENSPGDAREWIKSQLSGNDQEIAVSSFVDGAFWANFDDAVAMVNTIPSDQSRIELIEGVIKRNGTNYRDKVLQMIDEVDLSETQQAELRATVIAKE